jgi:hypothetical protein
LTNTAATVYYPVFYVLILFILLAVIMHVLSMRKNIEVYDRIHGVIRSRQDLVLLKQAINLNMQLAMLYIGLFIAFIIVLVVMVLSGRSFMTAVLMLFIAGVVTLPLGLIGKKYENKIKSLKIEGEDPELARIFTAYLKQWNEPRFRLPD